MGCEMKPLGEYTVDCDICDQTVVIVAELRDHWLEYPAAIHEKLHKLPGNWMADAYMGFTHYGCGEKHFRESLAIGFPPDMVEEAIEAYKDLCSPPRATILSQNPQSGALMEARCVECGGPQQTCQCKTGRRWNLGGWKLEGDK